MQESKRRVSALRLGGASCLGLIFVCTGQAPAKEGSVFYPPSLVANARANIAKHPWAADAAKQIVESARPWMAFSDDALWDLMFGPTITRSWMVLSYGQCPACKKDVRMYHWEIDAFARPWTCRCPHCKALFPKNDFHKFYRSGLDEHGVFDPNRADRSLLFNAEHPNPDDPLHTFGVDDGNGYAEGPNRWRFIGTYLVYGQWKQLVVQGIAKLAAAYLITGDPAYAHKAGILLDRVADLYPTFDFGKQAILYEQPAHRGYVSTWHDACREVEELVLAYDQVFPGLAEAKELPRFLSAKAKTYKLDNPKTSIQDIQRNIEERIFRDTLANRPKIESNYPTTDVAITLIKTVLDWPANRDEVMGLIDAIVKRSTAVDGLTGEKGLTGYSTIGPRNVAAILGRYDRIDSTFLAEMLKRHPQLHRTYRFHIDTWCLDGLYYPHSGDCGAPGTRDESYAGLTLARSVSLDPSDFVFLWRLYEATKDPAFVQVLYRSNDRKTDGLPYDLFTADSTVFQQAVAKAIEAESPAIRFKSTDKTQWHIAVLRSGKGPNARAVWLDYDAGGGHGHADGMNLGVFAKGLDLMMDFGYPPVSHGGWGGPRFAWYVIPASHNTVVVDGKGQSAAAGKTTLWADGERFRAIRASGAALIGGQQYERSIVMIDVGDADFYFLDVFRVVGGVDHAKFTHSHFSTLTTQGLSLKPDGDYGHGTLMRNFRTDAAPSSGWSVDWRVDDRYKYLPPGSEVHLRYTDLTAEAQASVCEGWVLEGSYALNKEDWLPTLMIRRRTERAPLATTFAGVFEVYGKTPVLAQVRRLPLTTAAGQAYPDSNVAAEVLLGDGTRDLIIAADVENPLHLRPAQPTDETLAQKDWDLHLNGQMCLVRRDRGGSIRHIALCHGKSLKVGRVSVEMKNRADFIEVQFGEASRAKVVGGDPEPVQAIRVNGQSVWER